MAVSSRVNVALGAALGVCVHIAAAQSFYDDFSSYNPSLWSQQTDIEHCNDGACFEARPDHLFYGPNGLIELMDQSPCNSSSKACCVGSTCAQWAAGHIRSVMNATYGHWEVVAQIAHPPSGAGPTPGNAFTCFGGYVGSPIHNEISMCWEGGSQTQIGLAYWYSSAEEKTTVTLGFDPSQAFHKYAVTWTPSNIYWYVDDQLLHTDSGTPKKTIPWEPMQFSVILRPRTAPYAGDAVLAIKSFNYTAP